MLAVRPTLFLIDGASGTGKSDLLEYVTAGGFDCGALLKDTTRTIRDYEREGVNLDLRFCSKAEFVAHGHEYTYTYNGEQYGFCRRSLDALVKKHSFTFAIIRDVSLIERLRIDFAECRIVAVYVRSDPERIEERMRRQRQTEEQIRFRLSRLASTLEDYRLHASAFDEVLENNSDRQSFHDSIRDLLLRHTGDSSRGACASEQPTLCEPRREGESL